MAAQKGRDFLIKADDGASGFDTLGGLREATLTISDEPVDITNTDSSGVRQMLAGKFQLAYEMSGSGVFVDDAAFDTLREAQENGTHLTMQFEAPGYGTFEGDFRVIDLSLTGAYDDAGTYELTFQSVGGGDGTGDVAFTAAV